MSVRSRLEGTVDVQRPVATATLPEEQDPSMPGIPTVAAPTTSLTPVAERIQGDLGVPDQDGCGSGW